jgi:hypothetical protein
MIIELGKVSVETKGQGGFFNEAASGGGCQSVLKQSNNIGCG